MSLAVFLSGKAIFFTAVAVIAIIIPRALCRLGWWSGAVRLAFGLVVGRRCLGFTALGGPDLQALVEVADAIAGFCDNLPQFTGCPSCSPTDADDDDGFLGMDLGRTDGLSELFGHRSRIGQHLGEQAARGAIQFVELFHQPVMDNSLDVVEAEIAELGELLKRIGSPFNGALVGSRGCILDIIGDAADVVFRQVVPGSARATLDALSVALKLLVHQVVVGTLMGKEIIHTKLER